MTVLVLSGGGLWSLGAIGVVEALDELCIDVDAYVGSSAGALLAALFASGIRPRDLRRLARDLSRRDFRVFWSSWFRALRGGRLPPAVFSDLGLWKRLDPMLQGQEWTSLERPLWVVATSLTERQPLVFGLGAPVRPEIGRRLHLGWQGQALDLRTALRASIAVPGLLSPVPWGDHWLVDGGVVDDYPVDVAAWMGADQIIGVWVDEVQPARFPARWNALHILQGSMTAMIRELSVLRQRQITVPVTTVRLEMDGGHRVFDRVTAIMDRGYQRARAQAAEMEGLTNVGV